MQFDSPRGSTEAPRLPFSVPFEEAIAWALARRAVLPDEFYGARPQSVRARSFAISGLATLDQVQAVADSLADATAAGETFAQWQRRMREEQPEVFSLGRARRELIFRNAVQTHYGIGRTIQQRANAAARGYLMWDAINDSRTRPAHAAMDGHVAPIDAEIWKRWHPPAGHNCLLPGTRVRGDFRIGLQTPYAGPAVEVLTRSGARLAVTGNHPVVTRDGWVAAKDIKIGDELLRYGRVVDSLALTVEHDQQSPPTVEQVFDALACEALGVADCSAFKLHGDAQFGEGEVHVAGADGELMHGVQPVRDHRRHQRGLESARDRVVYGSGHAERSTLASARTTFAVLPQDSLHVPLGRPDSLGNDGRADREQLVDPRNDGGQCLVAPVSSAPCGAALALDGFAVALDRGPLHQLGFAAPSNLRPVPNEQLAHGAADNAGLRGKSLLARAFAVLSQQLGHVLWRPFRPRPGSLPAHGVAVLRRAALNTGIAQQTAEQALAHGGLFKALAHGSPGEVSADQVISVRHFTFRGHVYDFETAQGWLAANGVIVSNCRCTRVALTEAQAQRRGLGKAAPAAEPDKGWEGDPTESNEDLVRVIEARRAACGTFASRRRRSGWNVDCAPQGDDSLLAGRTALGHAAPMPPPRALNLPLLRTAAPDDTWHAFMTALGAPLEREVTIETSFGKQLLVSRMMFTDHKTGASKLGKRGRSAYLLYIAEAILRPDEAWIRTGSFGDRTLLLLARFLRGREDFGVVAAFKEAGHAWEGWSAYQSPQAHYIATKRDGVLVFRRPET